MKKGNGMAIREKPQFTQREQDRLQSDYYISDGAEFQTYSQDSEFVNSLRAAHKL